MADILLVDSDNDTLKENIGWSKKSLAFFFFLKHPKISFTSYLEYKQKVQVKRDQLWTLNDFQKLLIDINWL